MAQAITRAGAAALGATAVLFAATNLGSAAWADSGPGQSGPAPAGQSSAQGQAASSSQGESASSQGQSGSQANSNSQGTSQANSNGQANNGQANNGQANNGQANNGQGPGPSGAKGGAGNGASDAPPGANGNIKVDEWNASSIGDTGPDNDPHLTCGLSVNFFGYDAGAHSATLTFTAQAPSSGGPAVTRDTDNWTVTRRTSGNQLDYTWPGQDFAHSLTNMTQGPHGYHLKVVAAVINADGTTTTKQKVFWLAPCGVGEEAAAAAAGATPGQVAPGSVTAGPTSTRSGSPVSVLGGTISTPAGQTAAGTAVLGETLTRTFGGTGLAPASVRAPRVLAATASRAALPFSLPFSLPFTGFSGLGALAWGAGLLGAGSGLVAATRRHRR